MADIARDPVYTPTPRRFGMRDFSRLASWGLVALGALTLAAYAASSQRGEDRLIMALANIRGVAPPERLVRVPEDPQVRRFTETVRELAADREQLAARLDTLERNVGDMTGSIARIAAAPPPVVPTMAPTMVWPAPAITMPEAKPAAPAPIQAVTPPVPAPDVPLPRAAAPQSNAQPNAQPTAEDTAAAKPEFGVDLGRANSVEGLRQLWNAVKGKHGAALEGLRPVVAIREVARAGGVEVRLVAGPLPNATAAARLCASLPGITCHPTVFEGQRLALR